MAKRTDHQIAIDDALTKELNRSDLINDRMANWAAILYTDFRAVPGVFFYVKGSAALARYLRNGGESAQTVNEICARSDWDTQLVINPLLSRADWFRTFMACEVIIRRRLQEFEEELLRVFKQMFLPNLVVANGVLDGRTEDRQLRGQQNELALRLREALATMFGNIFLATSQAEQFRVENTPKHWPVNWVNIDRLVQTGKVKDILELNIQAYTQATLTSALIHPGQSLDNLNSIMTYQELRQLTDSTADQAEASWRQLETASDDYDRIRLDLVLASPPVVEALAKTISEGRSDIAVINYVPAPVIEEAILRLHPDDRAPITQLWLVVKDERARQVISGDGRAESEVTFAKHLIQAFGQAQAVEQELKQWCVTNLTADRHLLSGMVALYEDQVYNALTPEARRVWDQAQAAVDDEFDHYEEEPDPEEVAEAEKRDTEKLAPYTLISLDKSTRKVGSILENMTIRDFYLFRLMVKCQLSNADPTQPLMPPTPREATYDVFKQGFKFRAELLDISVPRDDSLETAEQWAHTRHQVNVVDNIPLPNGDYFIDEYMLMFREVLEKKSSSAHKLTKRLRRACLIANVFARELSTTARWEQRRGNLARHYPLFGELVAQERIEPGNTVVFMRICEQLVESYDLVHNEKLLGDSLLMMKAFEKELRLILTTPLTHETFLDLMKIYTRIGKLVYHHTFGLRELRQRFIPHDALVAIGQQIVQRINAKFGDDPARARCGIVEDFAILLGPDLPAPLTDLLPRDVLTITACTNNAGKAAMEEVVRTLIPDIENLAQGAIEVVVTNEDLYAYLKFASTAPDQGVSGRVAFLKIHFILDEVADNWLVPTHTRDLKLIVKQYRRSLTRYTEYFALTQKKKVLQQLETILTTY